jgi:MtN3 and saliva related transmembrane protein
MALRLVHPSPVRNCTEIHAGMLMTPTDLIGYAAATLTTVSFVPQAVKALREHDTRSLSLGMYVIFTIGVILWGLYGWLRGDWVIILANLVTGALSVAILATKVRNDGVGSSARRVAEIPDAAGHERRAEHDREQ